MYVQKVRYLNKKFKTKEDIIKHLETHFNNDEWAYILHDKDKLEDGKGLAEPHIHISFYFKNARSPQSIANIMMEPPENKGASVEIIKGTHGKSNNFSYLLHLTSKAKDEGKHVYDADTVVANFPYVDYIKRCTSGAQANMYDYNDVLARIMSGDLILRDFFCDSVLGDANSNGLFYVKHKTKIETAIEAKSKMHMVSSLEEGHMEVIYIQGASGSGKTLFGKNYAKKKYGSCFMSGSKNDPIQDYMGEPVAIFDDARPEDFSASDWLKMLDPHNNKTTITSRYYNKFLAVQCIILTSVVDFHEFFVHSSENDKTPEPIDQFIRRFSAVLNVDRTTPNSDGRERASVKFYDIVRTEKPYDKLITLKGGNTRNYNLSYRLEENVSKNKTFILPEKTNAPTSDDIADLFEENEVLLG